MDFPNGLTLIPKLDPPMSLSRAHSLRLGGRGAGVSRSAAIVLGCLMLGHGYALKDACALTLKPSSNSKGFKRYVGRRFRAVSLVSKSPSFCFVGVEIVRVVLVCKKGSACLERQTPP